MSSRSGPAAALPERRVAGHVYYGATRSLCAVCHAGVEAKILFHSDAVWLEKHCPTHGPQSCLISSSVEWYLDALSFQAPQRPPARTATEVSAAGCPFDCGACPSHAQRVQMPVLAITSACNLDCPVCYTINRNEDPWSLSLAEMSAILAAIQRDRPDADIINFTGGEPTLHPDLPALLDLCRAAGLRRLTVSTNGIKLRDEAYVRALAAAGARIVLSLDTLDPAVDRRLLGADTVALKLRVLDLLEAHDVPTTILPAVAAGYNDRDVGPLFDLVMRRPHLRSLELHTVAFTGRGGEAFPRSARITVPDLHRLLDEATGGRVTGRDFVPSPLAHPHCYSICYLLCLDDGGYVPFTRFMPREQLYALLGDTLYLEPAEPLEEVFRTVIGELWADPDRLPESEAVLRTLKRLLAEVFPTDRVLDPLERQHIAERLVKAVYIHSHMDAETFDVGRVMRCCIAVPEADGRSIPVCAYNAIYRGRDARFIGPASPT